jgi:iron complex outermembrane recepter protein
MGSRIKTTLICGGAAISLMTTVPAWAQQRGFDVPAQPATKAIPEFARQAGVQIIAAGGRLHGKQTTAIKGDLEVRAALRQLLQGTGLRIDADDGSTIILARRDGADAAPAPAPAPPLPAADQNAESQRALPDIIVSATKRGETRIQDTPLSITGFDRRALERLGTTELDRVLAQVPGVNFIDHGGPGRGNSVASIRGLQPLGISQPVVAQYLDGAPRFIETYRMFDMGEVSVLRGPQGTLWGAQSIGGLISLRSTRPDLGGFGGYVQGGGYATADSARLSGHVSGAINLPVVTDKLAIRLAAQTINESGYVDAPAAGARDVNSVRDTSWRASLLWQPDSAVKFTLIYHGDHLRTGASSVFALDLPKYQTRNILSRRPGRQDFDLVNAIADIDLGGVTFNYTGAYFNFRNVYDDFSGEMLGASAINRTRDHQSSWTHELRLGSRGNHRLDWIAGIYLDQLNEDGGQAFIETLNPISKKPPVFGVGFPLASLGGSMAQKERALFGELYYHLTSKIELVAGGRLFNWSVNDQRTTIYMGVEQPKNRGKVSGTVSFFKAGINYRLNSDSLLYALRSEGFRAGGFNALVGPAFGIPDKYAKYNPDRAANYEIGFKQAFLDRRLSLNSDIYFLHWAKIQTLVRSSQGNFGYMVNAPDMNAWGGEIELATHDLIAEGLFFSANYAYTKNRFVKGDKLFPGIAGSIEKGDQLDRTIKHSWALNGEYRVPISTRSAIFLRANYTHKSPSKDNSLRATGYIYVPAQDIGNVSAGIERGPLVVRAYIDNVANGAPLMSIKPSKIDPTVAADVSTIRPRTFGLETSFRF